MSKYGILSPWKYTLLNLQEVLKKIRSKRLSALPTRNRLEAKTTPLAKREVKALMIQEQFELVSKDLQMADWNRIVYQRNPNNNK